MNLARFYNNRKEIYAQYPDLTISFGVKIWMVITTILVGLCLLNSVPLFLQQVFYIYNEVPYHEYAKKPNVEVYTGVFLNRNEEKLVSSLFS